MIRELTDLEQTNLNFINAHTVKSCVIILTNTGLKKSIMDATFAVRYFLKENGIHDYKNQLQGPSHKVLVESFIYSNGSFNESLASLYKPKTKKGDPRIWFTGLKKFINSSSAIAILEHKKKIYVFCLSDTNLISEVKNYQFTRNFFNKLRKKEESISEELFHKIYKIHKQGWIKGTGIGDKAVGETLEHLLGIETNSSKKPDYKGIELKAKRVKDKKKTKTRSNLFAQVADWKKSNIKSSKEMLDTYGYFRDGKYRLNCTVSTKVLNSQGLQFIIDETNEELHEIHINKDNKKTKCLIWPIEVLIDRLKTKHNETFWVEAESRIGEDGIEEFLYTKITHTKLPFLNQLVPLIEQGIITMDHLISAKEGKSAEERGPLFKMELKNLHLLFPDPNEIDLKMLK